MKTVFDANTGVEAHMIVHLLKSAGIEAQVFGEALQGGVGEIAAQGNVRVVVRPADAQRAHEVIAEWESTQAPSPLDASSKPSNGGLPVLFAFLIGVGVTSTFLVWAYNSPIDTTSADYNRDGKPDEFYYWRGERLSKLEIDRNFDGQIDASYDYSPRNGVKDGEVDDNFDGNFERISEFRNGQPIKDEVDVSGNGEPDYRYHYEDGVLTKIDIIRPSTGSVRKSQFYEDGVRMTKALWDSDSNGSLETLIKYDKFEEEISRSNVAE